VGKLYWENGNLKCEGVYKDDLVNGQGKMYYETGVLKSEGAYLKNKLTDKAGIIYNTHGMKVFEGGVVGGKLNGLGTKYHDDETGMILCQGTFKNGDLGNIFPFRTIDNSQSCKFYNKEGHLAYEGTVLDGNPHGKGKEYHPESDVVKYEGNFDNGVKSGTDCKVFNPKGNLEFEGTITNDTYEGPGTAYYEGNFVCYH
jgi:antitoxin component YwqK of YwqJK toxin-antitoxin module